MLEFKSGFDIKANEDQLLFEYGDSVFGPNVEQRKLDDIRKSLRNPNTTGPEIPYVIAMDVGRKEDLEDLKARNLLYGAMIYSKGKFGDEPVRSQGHIHAISASCNSSTAEVYEIWKGNAIIYMQEYANDNPGRCFAVYANAGDVVIVPPSWAHYTVNANPLSNMSFGAWCVRDYGFDYRDVREHGGLTFFPQVDNKGYITWSKNEKYNEASIIKKEAREYSEFGLRKGVPIYTQYIQNKRLFDFVTNPEVVKDIWLNYEP